VNRKALGALGEKRGYRILELYFMVIFTQ